MRLQAESRDRTLAPQRTCVERMWRLASLLCWAVLAVALALGHAAAGGNEFPAGGTRNLGRGGTGMTRADDPNVMVRNPALLADLWTSMAYSGFHLLIADSC